MKDTINFSNRHLSVDAMLQAAYKELQAKKEVTNKAIDIAKDIGYTHTTVINYLQGRGKDGYLKEAILEILKK
jgi:predicted transcriptional regulator